MCNIQKCSWKLFTLQYVSLRWMRASGLVSKESACNAGDPGSIPGSGRSPGEENGHLLQYSCLRNSMDRGAWWATVHGVARVRHGLASKPSPSWIHHDVIVYSTFNIGIPMKICFAPSPHTTLLIQCNSFASLGDIPFFFFGVMRKDIPVEVVFNPAKGVRFN